MIWISKTSTDWQFRLLLIGLVLKALNDEGEMRHKVNNDLIRVKDLIDLHIASGQFRFQL
jgi:hypothetical protein